MSAEQAWVDNELRERFPAATLTQSSYDDAIAFASAADDWSFDAIQLGPGQFRAASFQIALEAVLVNGLTCNLPMLLHAHPPRNRRSILVLAPACAPCLVNGRSVAAGECVVVTDSTAIEIVTSAALDILTLAVSEDSWPPNAAQASIQFWTAGLPWTERLYAAVTALRVDLMSEPGERHAVRQHAARVLTGILELQQSAAHQAQHPVRYRMLAVERARRYIHRHLANPLRVSAICEHAGVQARTLEYGFREMFGIPPVAYIKALRLNRVHRLLLSDEAQRRTVTQIALDCGFWHLSQFAADYQKLFGESPSVSRRRASIPTDKPALPQGSFSGRPSCRYAALCPPSA